MFKQPQPNIARQSFDTSYAELMDITPHEALKNFHTRHDQLIEEVSDASAQSKACIKGCAYCCHFKVIADAAEILAMVDFVKSNLHEKLQTKIMQYAKRNVEEAKNLSHEQQATINQRCPLLIDNACVVYPVRSIKCRNFHAVNDSGCKASFESPEDLSIINDSIPDLYIAATGSGDGFMAALHTQGYDDRIYDMNSAYIEAFNDPSCKRRYDARKRAFTTQKFET